MGTGVLFNVARFVDQERDWVFEPICYSSVDTLVGSLDEKIIRPAEGAIC
jgi:hypothetical protein